MTDLKALREAAEKALDCLQFPETAEPDPEVGTNLEHSSGVPLGWMTSGAHARFVVLANPTAIIALLDRLKEAEEALKPFATYADDYEGCHDDEALDFITLATLRRARAHLERHNNE